jgi:hypothetical protein
MTNPRRAYSQAEELALTTQVEGRCPLCDKNLFYTKGKKSYKGYELAHIYPLNPTPEEVQELKGGVLLHTDVNHPDNIMPLCTACHPRFDKPRTRDEYNELAALKRKCIDRAIHRTIMNDYPLEAEIDRIVSRLSAINFEADDSVEIQYNAKSLEDKFKDTLPVVTQRKIRHDVTDYYQHIKRELATLERQSPAISNLICAQVKSYYLKQSSLGLPQSDIFTNVVEWFRIKTSTQTLEAAQIVASFFVQNCEVFE